MLDRNRVKSLSPRYRTLAESSKFHGFEGIFITTRKKNDAPFPRRNLLAWRLHDDEGEWDSTDEPRRDLFAGLVTNYTARYRDGMIQDDLRDIGWLYDNKWTDKARRDLRAELFITSPAPRSR